MDVFTFPLRDAKASSDVNSKRPTEVRFVPEEDVKNNNLDKETASGENPDKKVITGEGEPTMISLPENNNEEDSTFQKEVLTAFSRCGGGNAGGGGSGGGINTNGSLFQNPQIFSGFQIHSGVKLGSFFDRLSSWTEDSSGPGSRGFVLPSFVVAGIASNLKSLGVEEIDCKEYVEMWLSQRRQRQWKNTMGGKTLKMFNREGCTDTSRACIEGMQGLMGSRTTSSNSEITQSTIGTEKSETLTVFSPSEPNSSLLRLTGDGNVKLGHVLSKMDEVRGHFNNAVCTLLQATIVLILPYMKLLSGNKVDLPSCEVFIDEWIQIVGMMAQELKPESGGGGKGADMMLSREYFALRNETGRLYKRLGKLYKKVVKMFEQNEKDSKPALQRLQPKGLPLYRGRRTGNPATAGKTGEKGKDANGNTKETGNASGAAKKECKYQPPLHPAVDNLPVTREALHFPPVPLFRANLTIKDVFKQHIFFSKSKQGFLVCKDQVDEEWKKFSELSFKTRRELFLHVVDDLHWTLNMGTSVSNQVKELLIEGYPDNVTVKLAEILKYLKEVAKDGDLLVLTKVTIANHVKSLNESLGRLVQTLKDVKRIAKCFCKSVRAPVISTGGVTGSLWKRKIGDNIQQHARATASNSTLPRDFVDCEVNLSLRFDNSRVRLMVAYPSLVDPFTDKYSVPDGEE